MIGFYDTGLGGSHIISLVTKDEPNLKYIFFADKEFLPLGNKSPQEIQDRTVEVTKTLFDRGARLVILACNTASVNSIRYIQENLVLKHYPDRNVLGVTTPLIELLVRFYQEIKSQSGVMLATPATCNSEFYQKELEAKGFSNLTTIPCPYLAKAIELNQTNQINDIIEKLPIKSSDKYVILACTHYSLIANKLQEKYPELEIVDPSPYIAKRILWYLKKHPEYLR